MSKPVIWIINHYAIPPREAGGTRHYDFAYELKTKWQYEVYIIASKFNHLSKQYIVKDKGTIIENIKGVNFIWIDTIDYQKNNWRRVINLFQFTAKLLFFHRKIKVKKPDIIIGSTVHPFASSISAFLAVRNKCDFIFEIRDLWPQTFIDMGIWPNGSFKSRIFRIIEKFTVNKSKKIIALSPLTITYLSDRYNYNVDNVLYLPNSVVLKNFTYEKYIKHNTKKIVIMYLGGIDVVHGLESLFKASETLEHEYRNKIEIHIVGDGKKRNEYIELTKDISIVKWHSPIPKSEVAEKLKKADVLYLSTGKVLYGSENKLAEYLAVGRPLLVSTEGDHNNPVYEIECGISVKPNDINALIDAIIKLYNLETKHIGHYAQNARSLAENRYSIEVNAKKLANFLDE